MAEKELNIVILGVIAVIAVIGLALLFKAEMTGVATGGRTATMWYGYPTPPVLEKAGDPSKLYTYLYMCDWAARVGHVPKGFIWEANTPEQRAQREKNQKNMCYDAPAEIQPTVIACCLPPTPQ